MRKYVVMGNLAGLALLLVLAAPSFAEEAAAEDGAEKILNKIRIAIGYDQIAGDSKQRVLRCRIRDLGAKEVVVETTFSPDGRFLKKTHSPMERVTGFDGTTPWLVAWGCGRALTLSGRESNLMGAWIRTGYWLHPDAPLTVKRLPEADEEDKICLSFRLNKGLIDWIMMVDKRAWLPETLTLTVVGRETIIAFHEYADHGGWKMADRITVHSYGRLVRESFTESLKEMETADESLYAPRMAPPADIRFDPDLSHVLEVKPVPGHGGLLVHPLINGKDVGWLLYDTGAAGWTLSTTAAEAAGLEALRESPTTGTAGVQIESSICLARTMQLGPALFENQIVRVTATAGLGGDCVGLVGYGLFARCVVEYDSQVETISIFDPSEYRNEDAAWVDMVPGQLVPTIEASFEGHTELFRVDTGASSDLVLNSPCVARLGLLEGRETYNIEAAGIDGSFTIQRGTIDWIEFGGRRFPSVPTDFSTLTSGVLADPYTAGIICNGLLKPFKLVLDYSRNRIAFVTRS